MARIVHPAASRGSQYWLQHFVRTDPHRLDGAIGLGPLQWLSPLELDEYAEYRDADFLKLLGVELTKRPLDAFWPAGGPVWDGLALTQGGTCVLVEAKAHIPEMVSSCAAAAPASIKMIQAALRETQAAFDVDPAHNWCEGHYQYANRLAHAYLMNELNDVPTELVFVYFVGDLDMKGPATRDEWVSAVLAAHESLGALGQLPCYVHDVFVEVGDA